MNDFDGILRDAVTGIKRRKKRVKLSRFNAQDGVVSDIDEIKDYVPGKGIVHIQEVQAKILDCGHSAGLGLGHVCDDGHAVCAMCVNNDMLICAYPGCFKKLCVVRGCPNYAYEIDTVLFCKEHSTFASIVSFGSFLFLGPSKASERLDKINRAYYSARLQIRDKR